MWDGKEVSGQQQKKFPKSEKVDIFLKLSKKVLNILSEHVEIGFENTSCYLIWYLLS